MVGEDFLWYWRQECHKVGQCERYQVAVCGRVQWLGPFHRQHHHQVPHDPNHEDAGLEESAHHSIEGVVVLRIGANETAVISN